MFLCSECNDSDLPSFMFPGSYGRCEGCGETEVCADVPSWAARKNAVPPEVDQ